MNKRLRQFERESGLEIYGLGQDRVKWKSVVEKFAQLIVAECVDLVAELSPDSPYNMVNHIEKHFENKL